MKMDTTAKLPDARRISTKAISILKMCNTFCCMYKDISTSHRLRKRSQLKYSSSALTAANARKDESTAADTHTKRLNKGIENIN